MTIQRKALEQYFHVVLSVMLYKVVLTYKYVHETLVHDHSNVSFLAVSSYGAVCLSIIYLTVEVKGLTFRFVSVPPFEKLGIGKGQTDRQTLLSVRLKSVLSNQ